MQPIHEILPGLIGDPEVRKVRARRNTHGAKSRRKTPLGFGTRTLFPPLEILRPAWEHIVGKPLALRTRPISVIGKRLVVEVPDTAWRRQLVRYEGAFVDRIRHLLGDDAITGLDWKVNAALDMAAQPEPQRKPPQRELDPTIREAASSIQDEELRELFLRQAARLAR
jgi:hypothetical protein